jgi:hypothetical protein
MAWSGTHDPESGLFQFPRRGVVEPAVLADQPARLARHLAAATDQPDEQVAATLEACAHLILRRATRPGPPPR